MTDFTLHSAETAPPASAETLRTIEAARGTIPNIYRVLAEAPAALAGYLALTEAFAHSTLTPVERHLVYLAVNYENESGYCMSSHTLLAQDEGVPDGVIEALREGQALRDERLEALRRFATNLVVERGHVSQVAVDRFIAAGFTRAQVLEVILAVSAKTLSNYVNHVTHLADDATASGERWVHPVARGETAGV